MLGSLGVFTQVQITLAQTEAQKRVIHTLGEHFFQGFEHWRIPFYCSSENLRVCQTAFASRLAPTFGMHSTVGASLLAKGPSRATLSSGQKKLNPT
nr:hypothetical protein FEE99_10580 [Pseudomonas sp. ef1]